MLPLVALGLCAASLVINIIGLAIPYWYYLSGGGITVYQGLWTGCVKVDGVDAVCDSLSGAALTDEIEATRAMELLGMLVMLAALVCALLKLLVMKDQALLPKIGAGCAIAAGILMILGTIIYATGDGDSSNLHAGFALCIVAGVIGIVAGVVMFLGSKGE